MLRSTRYYASYRATLTKQLMFLTKADFTDDDEKWLNAFGNLLRQWFHIEDWKGNHKKLLDDLKKRDYI